MGVVQTPGNIQTCRQGIAEEVNVAMPLLNYSTKIPAEQTAAEIMSILVRKGATDNLTHYGPAGMATGLNGAWRRPTDPWASHCP